MSQRSWKRKWKISAQLTGAGGLLAKANYLPSNYRPRWSAWPSTPNSPKVLRELFEALGNDPFVIAESLARPALAERLSADLSAQGKIMCFESATRIKGLHSMPITTALGNSAYTLPRISGGGPPCTDDTWTATTIINAPDARGHHTAVWTGSEMIVWGGDIPPFTYFNTGGRYTPATDSWIATSTANAPAARTAHTAVWTGSEMIVWGGRMNTGNV